MEGQGGPYEQHDDDAPAGNRRVPLLQEFKQHVDERSAIGKRGRGEHERDELRCARHFVESDQPDASASIESRDANAHGKLLRATARSDLHAASFNARAACNVAASDRAAGNSARATGTSERDQFESHKRHGSTRAADLFARAGNQYPIWTLWTRRMARMNITEEQRLDMIAALDKLMEGLKGMQDQFLRLQSEREELLAQKRVLDEQIAMGKSTESVQ